MFSNRFTVTAMFIILLGLQLCVIGCESGQNLMINTVLVEDIIENCPGEVVEIGISDTEYEIIAVVDKPCLDAKVEEANAADDTE